MRSNTSEDPWDFGSVLNFLHTFSPTQPSGPPRSAQGNASYSSIKPLDARNDEAPPSPHLGNFDNIFKTFSVSVSLMKGNVEPPTEVPPLSEAETTPSTVSSDHETQPFEDFIRTKEVRWHDEVEVAITTPTPSSKRRNSSIHNQPKSDRSNPNIRERRHKSRSSVSRNLAVNGDFGSETDTQTIHQTHLRGPTSNDIAVVSSSGPSKPALASSKHLTPAWVTPLRDQTQSVPSIPPVLSTPNSVIAPIAYLTREEKRADIIRILKEKLGPRSLKYIDVSEVLSHSGGNEVDGLHVFVDSSNILIGFYESLKMARGINKKALTKRAPFSFTSLALIMERGRGVAKRVLVGSTNQSGIIPDYMLQAARCGYEINSLERVEKYKEDYTPGKHRRHFNTSGSGSESTYKDEQSSVRNRRYRMAYGSGSETPYSGVKKISEQGVDEILHMKMLESMIDAKEPSTMVLATGDAAEAEYSAGFLKNIERALEKGWRVELVAWRHSMSYAYKSGSFLEKWKGRFSVLELDNFTEDLLALYVSPSLEGNGDW